MVAHEVTEIDLITEEIESLLSRWLEGAGIPQAEAVALAAGINDIIISHLIDGRR